MKQTLKLAGIEFGKLFKRPAIFVITFILIAILGASYFNFSPEKNNLKIDVPGATNQEIYDNFVGSTISTVNYTSLDNQLNDLLVFINNKINKTDYCESFKQKAADLISDTNAMAENMPDITGYYSTLQTAVNELIDFVTELKTLDIDFLFPANEQQIILKKLKNIRSTMTNANGDNAIEVAEVVIDKVLNKNYGFETVCKKQLIDKYERYIDEYYFTEMSKLRQSCIDSQSKTDNIMGTVTTENTFYWFNNQTTTDESLKTMKLQANQVFSIVNMTSEYVKNAEILNLAKGYTQKYLASCLGFENINLQVLQNNVIRNEYMLKNNIFDFQVNDSFNFNSTSSSETSALDFAFFAMQILAVAIVAFTLFSVASMFAEDQANGTIKFLAIRPIKRGKIIVGKSIACFLFGALLMLLSCFASLGLGLIIYGVPSITTSLVVFNGSMAFTINSFVLYFIYFSTLLLNLIFFISIGALIGTLTKNNAVTIFTTFVLILTFTILNGLLSFSSIMAFLPFAHLDFFRYFGNPQYGILKLGLIPECNIWISVVYYFLFIPIVTMLTLTAFKQKDLA